MRPLDANLTVQTISIGPPGRQGPPGVKGGTGVRGLQGIRGIKGEPGRQVLTVEGPPAPGTGNNGDIAIDVLNFEIFGPKSNGNWGSGSFFGGRPPQHFWDGTALSFENPDGTAGEPVDLRGSDGSPGHDGGPIPPGGAPGQVPTPLPGGGYGWRDIPGLLGDFDGGEF